MLIPQYTIRWLLLMMAGCAVVFSIFGFAARGNTAALGVSLAIGALAVVLLTHAAGFGLVWLFAVVTAPLRGRPAIGGQSPFASGVVLPLSEESMPIVDNDIPASPILLE